MALFKSSKDLFELISPGSGPAASLGTLNDQPSFFMVDGRPLVVVDDSYEPAEQPAGEINLRKDTLGVIAVVGAVLVLVAFLAGRATVRAAPAKASPAVKAPILAPGVFDATSTGATPPPASEAQPATAGPLGAGPGPTAALRSVLPAKPARKVVPGKYELQVVTTTREKAAKVVSHLNEDPASPLAARMDLEAYARGRAVRVRGFAKEDKEIARKVRAMKDPTGGGNFKGAYFRRSSR